jgi:hypothetical protein
MNKEHQSAVKKALELHHKFNAQCDELTKTAIDLLSKKGVDIENTFTNIFCDYIPGDGICFTLDLRHDTVIPHVITCKSFFDCFDHGYKDGDDIIQELIKSTI